MSLAIIWGVGSYKNFGQEDWLRGPANDIKHIRLFSHNERGYSNKDIIVFQDSKATEAAVKKAWLDMLLGQSGPPKKLFAYGSSHGTNNPDSSQKDGLQEMLCMYDIEEDNGIWVAGFISAKWIGEAIRKMRPEDTLDLILDCCHAPEGSQLKGLGRSYNRARWLPRSEPVSAKVKPKTIKQVQHTIPKNVALWAPCEPDQTSADSYIDKQWQGAFTATLLDPECYRKGRTRQDIIYYTRIKIKEDGYKQVPHLYCWKELAVKPLA